MVHKTACKRTWDALKALLSGIAAPLVEAPDCSDAERKATWEKRAIEVETLGKEFVDALKVVHPKCTSLYAHVASAHVGDEFRRHGYWPVYGGDGLEAKHSVTKQLQRRVTNSLLYQRLNTLMSHYTMREDVMDDARVCLLFLSICLYCLCFVRLSAKACMLYTCCRRTRSWV